MYYEIDSTGNKLRTLPGYFEGYKADLADVDESLLSDTQKDYMSIPIDSIIKVTEEEHILSECKKSVLKTISDQCKEGRAKILDDIKIMNILSGATAGYPEYLTPSNVAKFIELYKTIYHVAASKIKKAVSMEAVNVIVSGIKFPTATEIVSSMQV